MATDNPNNKSTSTGLVVIGGIGCLGILGIVLLLTFIPPSHHFSPDLCRRK